jgi:hypothetical protein
MEFLGICLSVGSRGLSGLRLAVAGVLEEIEKERSNWASEADTLRFLLRKRKSGKAYLESVLNKGCCEVLCCE